MNMIDKSSISEYRDLTPDERTLLEWLLANGHKDAMTYASQLSQVKVVSRCTCGCPTMDLAVGEKKSRTTGVSTILADARGYSAEGIEVDVILHAREGELSELEVYSLDGTSEFTLPKIESMKPY
jgi:hypothetical protein